MEIGIEPTARHAADLGIVPVIVEDACGSGHPGAAQRSVESLETPFSPTWKRSAGR
jgi:nicotinamidase-related amidase